VLRGRALTALWLSVAAGGWLAWYAQQLDRRGGEERGGEPPHPAAAGSIESTPFLEGAPVVPAELAAAAAHAGLDPALVLAVIEAESGHDPAAVSAKGAVGLMQVLPETAALLGFAEVADPATNLEAGCRYLASLLDRFGGDTELALAAYNAGPGAVRRWGTIPPYRETREFVARVAAAYRELTGVGLEAAARVMPEPSGVL
jgi:soluble lytic murein transglycosylase-like protein